jgi:hypothetical protein
MQNKLALALGGFSKYLAVQLFFFSYVLSIFIQAKAPSQKIYLTGMFFYLLPLVMAMVFVHFGYTSTKSDKINRLEFFKAICVLIFYCFIWHALF